VAPLDDADAPRTLGILAPALCRAIAAACGPEEVDMSRAARRRQARESS
jgi:hypothetical protein